MKKLFVILSISIVSYSFYSFSSDKDNKKQGEVCSFIPFKTFPEFLKEHGATTGNEVQECHHSYYQWYSQWVENNENLAYQEYLKKPHPAKQEFEKHLPEGLRKDIGNIVQGYLYVDFQQWEENNKKLLNYAKKGNIQSIQELLESGDVNINTQNQCGQTALMHTVQPGTGNKELVRLLLEKGANVNAQERDGSTVLMYAVRFRNKEIVKLLLEKSADKDIKNNDGDTALMIAQKKGYKDIAEILNKNVLA